jgi:hypothetical protein
MQASSLKSAVSTTPPHKHNIQWDVMVDQTLPCLRALFLQQFAILALNKLEAQYKSAQPKETTATTAVSPTVANEDKALLTAGSLVLRREPKKKK